MIILSHKANDHLQTQTIIDILDIILDPKKTNIKITSMII